MGSLTRSFSSLSSTAGDSLSLETGFERHDYTIGWICALAKEQTAAAIMLDKRHQDILKQRHDPNTYRLGSIGPHNVVIACLPVNSVGINTAATVAVWMTSAFPSVRLCLLVGIGSGIPSKVSLGDVVVGIPMGELSGVAEWDMARDGKYEKTGQMSHPPNILLSAITRLESEHELEGSKIPDYLDRLEEKYSRLASKYLISEALVDPCLKAISEAVNGNESTGLKSKESDRPSIGTEESKERRRETQIHQGLIVSTNKPIKDKKTRDSLISSLPDDSLICIETEAAGLMTNFPCIVIRGICDYADEHNTKEWQEPAAAMAAAFAKEVLSVLPAEEVAQMPTIKSRGPSVF